MSDTATGFALNNLTGKTSAIFESPRANWKFGKLEDDHLVIAYDEGEAGAGSYESAAVGLREMSLSAEAVRQIDELLASPSRSTIVPRDLPSS